MASPPLTLHTARTGSLDAATRESITSLCTEAHGEDFGPLFSYLPDDGLHILGSLGELLISHAIVTERWLQPEGLPLLRTAYVDAVATLPAYQTQGYGSATMRYLAACIQPDFDIACLQTGRSGFYARLGWETWRGSLAGRGEAGLIPTPQDCGGVMILRLPRTPALDLDGLLTIEQQPARIW